MTDELQGFVRVRRTIFPDRAGEHQRDGATPELIRELGGNYPRYHAFLAARIKALGGSPQPKDFESAADYFEACADLQDLVRAEIVLRTCADSVRDGRSLDQGPAAGHGPLLGKDDELLRSERLA